MKYKLDRKIINIVSVFLILMTLLFTGCTVNLNIPAADASQTASIDTEEQPSATADTEKSSVDAEGEESTTDVAISIGATGSDAAKIKMSEEKSVSVMESADAAKDKETEEDKTTVIQDPSSYTVPGTKFTFDARGIEGQPYLVAVNRILNTVTVYGKDTNGNYTVPVTAFICSVGSAYTGTPTGRYVTEERYEWRQMVDGSYARNAIRVWKGIMFHSVGYYTKNAGNLEYEEFNKLGSSASLGCIRLCYRDISWIYANCPTGFVTIIYDDATSAGPLGKPSIEKIDVNDATLRKWDPTDPECPTNAENEIDAEDEATDVLATGAMARTKTK